jgi:hypothetical protein
MCAKKTAVTLASAVIDLYQVLRFRLRKENFQRIGSYNQHAADQFPYEKSPVEYLQDEFNLDYQDARKNLGRYGLASKFEGIMYGFGLFLIAGFERDVTELVRSMIFQ